MQVQLELLHLFFCFGYATIASTQWKNHRETLATASLFLYGEDCRVIFHTAVQSRDGCPRSWGSCAWLLWLPIIWRLWFMKIS